MDRAKLAISFEPDFRGVDAARKAIDGFCRGLFDDHEAGCRIDDLCLAVAEALNNAVEHSGARSIAVDVTANETNVLLTIANDGTPFDPTQYELRPSIDDCEQLPEGGFGVAIVRELVDEIAYRYVDGRNLLSLGKQLRARGEA